MDFQDSPPPNPPKSQSPTPEEISKLLDKLVPPAETAPAETSAQAGEETWNPGKILGMIRRKAWVIGVLAIAFSAYTSFRNTKQVVEYESSFRLLVEPVNQKKELQTLTDGGSSATTQELDYSTQIEVMYSPKLLNPILEEVNEEFEGTTFESTVGRISVVRLGETKIIEVRFYDTNPDKVTAVLEQLAEGYLDYSLQDQQSQLRQGMDFVNKELPAIQNRVNTLQQEIQNLRQTYNFTDPDSYAAQLLGQLGAIAQQRQALKTELSAMQVQYQNLQEQLGMTTALGQSANYQATLQQYQVLEKQIAIESARFGARNPSIELLQRQQTNLLPILQRQAEEAVGMEVAAVANQMQMLIAKDQSIAEVEKILNERFQQMPAVSRVYAELQQQLSIASESLTRFLETQERLQIQASQNEVPWQLIAEPAPPYQRPLNSLYKALTTGAMMGAALGVVVAVLLEKLENTYYTSDELRKHVKLPILGIIPYNPDLEQAEPSVHIVDLRQYHENGYSITEDSVELKQRLKSFLQPAQPSDTPTPGNSTFNDLTLFQGSESQGSPGRPAKDGALAHYWLNQSDAYGFLEAFRALYANLERRKGQQVRSLVISSALPTEGRTTVAVHLVQAAAALGKRVLLVDAHCRRGGTQVHTLLGLSNKIGLTHFLTEEASLNQVIQRLSWEPHLFAISAGATPPDPTRLLASSRMDELMSRLPKTFDLVVYDMPPLMGLADVNLIASQADGIILVTSLGKRGCQEALSRTIERLKIAHLPILGMVANQARDHLVDLYVA